MHRIIFIFTLIVSMALCCDALTPSERTTRRGLKARSALSATVPDAYGDTVRDPSADAVKVSGFDKPLRSRFETMFVTNRLSHTLAAVCFTIDYADAAGRQLHQSVRTVRCDIPSGETRQLKFPTWDTQNAFYYVMTGKPRRSEGAPFDVTCRINYVITSNDGASD